MTSATVPARHRSAAYRPFLLARGRLVLLVGGALGLLSGLWTGLARAGLVAPSQAGGAHGLLMVLGFLGTLIALERAVALGVAWGYLAPALSGCAVAAVLLGLPRAVGGLAFAAAGSLVTAIYGVTLRRRYDTALAIMAIGAVAWLAAAALWLGGLGPVRLAPMLAAFLVFTIVGERLELSRLLQPTPAVRRRLLAALGLFAVGVALTVWHYRAGLLIGGVGLVGQALWLARHDIARVTVRKPGLPRFAAVCLLAGYLWLGVGGTLWVALGAGIPGSLLHDAALHAIFLGFAISMVMGHAPIILPAVLRISLPHRRLAWLPLALLHASVALRVGFDLAGSSWGRGLSAAGNVAALLAFVGLSAATAIRASRTRSHSPAPATTTTSNDHRRRPTTRIP